MATDPIILAWRILWTEEPGRLQSNRVTQIWTCLKQFSTHTGGQWLRLHAPNAGALGSIPGQGTRAHTPQLKFHMPQLKISPATTNTWHSQINKNNI